MAAPATPPIDLVQIARDLMRRGVADEAIEARTGLGLPAILDLRASAAFEDGLVSKREVRTSAGHA